MKRFIEGADRTQSVLFAKRLDEKIGKDNPVRAIDIFVDTQNKMSHSPVRLSTSPSVLDT